MKRRILLTLGLILALVAIPACLGSRGHAKPVATLAAVTRERLRAELPGEIRDVSELPRLIGRRRVVLFGELHLVAEPQRFLTDLLSQPGDAERNPLLELSRQGQPGIDLGAFVNPGGLTPVPDDAK